MHNHAPENYQCPPCGFMNQGLNTYHAPSDIVIDGQQAIALISTKWWSETKGGLVIIPKEHYENIYDIPDQVLSEINVMAKKVAIALKTAYRCDGVSTRQHNEPAGNQTTFHFHIQVIPRYKDDNFYQNLEKSIRPSPEERAEYAERLKGFIEIQEDC